MYWFVANNNDERFFEYGGRVIQAKAPQGFKAFDACRRASRI